MCHPDTNSEIDAHSNSDHKPDPNLNHEINSFLDPNLYLDPKSNHNPDTNIIHKPNPNADFLGKCIILTLFLHMLFIIRLALGSHKNLLLKRMYYFNIVFAKLVFTNTAEFHLNLL